MAFPSRRCSRNRKNKHNIRLKKLPLFNQFVEERVGEVWGGLDCESKNPSHPLNSEGRCEPLTGSWIQTEPPAVERAPCDEVEYHARDHGYDGYPSVAASLQDGQ